MSSSADTAQADPVEMERLVDQPRPMLPTVNPAALASAAAGIARRPSFYVG